MVNLEKAEADAKRPESLGKEDHAAVQGVFTLFDLAVVKVYAAVRKHALDIHESCVAGPCKVADFPLTTGHGPWNQADQVEGDSIQRKGVHGRIIQIYRGKFQGQISSHNWGFLPRRLHGRG